MRSTLVPWIGCALLFVPLSMPGLHVACAQERTADKEIAGAIGQFFASLSKRDVHRLQAVLYAPEFVGIEAGGQKAQAHVIQTDKPEEVLPPEANDDWDHVIVSDVKVRRSATHASVAMASFTVGLPLEAEVVASYREMLEDRSLQLREAQREALRTMIDEGAANAEMFAMFARQDGTWRIVCISLPK